MAGRDRRLLYCVCATAVGGGLFVSAAPLEGQEVRVLLIRPTDANVAAVDVAQIFQQAIREAAPDIAFVTHLAEATDVIEFTSYKDDFLAEGKEGVTSRLQFSFRPLLDPDDPPAARARPGNFGLVVRGSTRAEAVARLSERLNDAMRRLLERFRTRVPK
jgi:hypothetical protein